MSKRGPSQRASSEQIQAYFREKVADGDPALLEIDRQRRARDPKWDLICEVFGVETTFELPPNKHYTVDEKTGLVTVHDVTEEGVAYFNSSEGV